MRRINLRQVRYALSDFTRFGFYRVAKVHGLQTDLAAHLLEVHVGAAMCLRTLATSQGGPFTPTGSGAK